MNLDAKGPDVNSDDLKRLLIAHTEAWNSHDIERLMSLFADDCVFDASGGPESHGRRFVGRDQVTAAFADVLDSMPDANWGDGHHRVISDDYGVSEWRLTGTLLDGSRVDVLGCDFLTVRDNKIVRKNSFRKQRPPVADWQTSQPPTSSLSVIRPPVLAVGDDGAAGVIGGSHEAHFVPEADAS